jgi:hypothetical protein
LKETLVAELAGGFEQHMNAVEVGGRGRVRVQNGAVVVAFGGEVENGVHVA